VLAARLSSPLWIGEKRGNPAAARFGACSPALQLGGFNVGVTDLRIMLIHWFQIRLHSIDSDETEYFFKTHVFYLYLYY
jgi:hypothetical protein